MVEINDWLWEGLYTMKKLYDHGRADGLMEEYRNCVLDGDYIGDIAMSALEHTFADTRMYWYTKREEVDVYVCFDPIIDEFYSLCRKYEEKNAVPPGGNPHRSAMDRAIRSGFYFNDYSYTYRVYDGTPKKGRARLVLILYPDFCSLYEVSGGMLEIYDAYCDHVKTMKKEFGIVEEQKIVMLPAAAQDEKKEAA